MARNRCLARVTAGSALEELLVISTSFKPFIISTIFSIVIFFNAVFGLREILGMGKKCYFFLFQVFVSFPQPLSATKQTVRFKYVYVN